MKRRVTHKDRGERAPAEAVAFLADTKGVAWLDSSLQLGEWGRLSLLATEPVEELVLEEDTSGFFRELERQTADGRRVAIGYIAYEASLPWLRVHSHQATSPLPRAHFLVYDSVQWFEHGAGDVTRRQADDHPRTEAVNASAAAPVVTPTMSRADYLAAVERIKWHIHEGDIYQANFTNRFDCQSEQPPLEVYLRLRRLNPAPYSAYIDFGDYQVLSSSPERMLFCRGGRIHSSPIKGTIARGSTERETAANLERLLSSAKDRAELLMIVDLVRNDLGKIARVGSVRVDRLFRPEVYSSVIHLMADISAELRPEVSLEHLLAALLPGGSITGAPKKRAVEIIDALEVTPRSVYTGCIGYLGGGTVDLNIAIRTIVRYDGVYHLHAGGGIVADSEPEAEYDEMLLKAANLFKCLGVTSWQNDSQQ